MDVGFDLYKVFVSVANNGSVSKAAQELCVTQSAVSQRILKLEKIYEKALFVRSGHMLKLSAFGENLYKQCCNAVSELDKVYDSMMDINENKDVIVIAASDTIATRIVVPTLKHFQNKKIIIESLLSDKEKIKAVENGTVDFAIINNYNLPLSDSLYKRRLLSLEYGFYYNKNLLSMTEGNLYEKTLLLKNSRTKGRIEFNKRFYALKYKFKNTIEFSHDDSIIEATKAGLGIGFCPAEYVKEEGLQEVKLSSEKFTKDIVLIYQQNTNIVDAFVGLVKKN